MRNPIKLIIHDIIQEYYEFKYFFFINKFKKVHIATAKQTLNMLINSNNSLSRFGEGEMKWIFQQNSNTFEKNSPELSKALIKVLQSNNKQLSIALPHAFSTLNDLLGFKNRRYRRIGLAKYGIKFMHLLDKNRQYYDTEISRPYIDYQDKQIASMVFNKFKLLCNNKKLLIVEGLDSRIGATNDLLSGALTVKRIECPVTNAFESYKNIKKDILDFLSTHRGYLTLISLGPAATILPFDLLKFGYRSIDIGHIDLEYEWYLLGATHRIDIPTKYINGLKNGGKIIPVNNKKFYSEIVDYVK